MSQKHIQASQVRLSEMEQKIRSQDEHIELLHRRIDYLEKIVLSTKTVTNARELANLINKGEINNVN